MPRGLCHLSNPLSWTDKNKYTIWTVSAYQAVRRIEKNWRARMVTSCGILAAKTNKIIAVMFLSANQILEKQHPREKICH